MWGEVRPAFLGCPFFFGGSTPGLNTDRDAGLVVGVMVMVTVIVGHVEEGNIMFQVGVRLVRDGLDICLFVEYETV